MASRLARPRAAETTVGGLQASEGAWIELLRASGVEGVAELVRVPELLKARLQEAEEAVQRAPISAR